ncbi:hypothetical protein NP590_20160 [Methylomonas sp. SURF-2]|uniref:Uncharacterized protein n=1 Tax=Methylomonas subterranea TaxID=2952225 RepID=A0ABT1TLT9_9GAMM|nr:hypothetical protein [Methylomonas sp. SURF-2]MCQ8106424.1 hypothetical protein [Methylomonas sp. SURF-2]
MIKIFLMVLCFLISGNAHSKYPYESLQHAVNRAVKQTDTVFVGRILEKREIDRGLIVGTGAKHIGMLEVEVIKKYRGRVIENEKRLVCTWFDRTEHDFNFRIGQELIFFGIDTGLNIQLPSTYRYIRASTGIEKELSKALKLRSKPIKDWNLIFEIVEASDNVTRNACNEPDAWQLQTQDGKGK